MLAHRVLRVYELYMSCLDPVCLFSRTSALEERTGLSATDPLSLSTHTPGLSGEELYLKTLRRLQGTFQRSLEAARRRYWAWCQAQPQANQNAPVPWISAPFCVPQPTQEASASPHPAQALWEIHRASTNLRGLPAYWHLFYEGCPDVPPAASAHAFTLFCSAPACT